MTYSLVKLNSARNCLRYVVRAYEIEELYIPYYLCSAIRLSLSKEHCKIKFYHIDENFYPSSTFKEDDYILYPNYFGVCSENVNKLSRIYKNLIVDNAHSFYSNPVGIASFNSIRKFFPLVRDGAFLYTKQTIDNHFPKDDYNYDAKILTYEEICKNELRLDSQDIKLISDCSENIFLSLNEEKYKKIRIENYKKISNIENSNEIPFAIPFLCKDKKTANEMVQQLKKQGYMIYRYWNNLPDSYFEKTFYERLVVIPLIKNSDV